LCEAKDFDASKFLVSQWMMFMDRHPMCLDDNNDIILKGGMASTHTKALTINVKKCTGPSCASSYEINRKVDGLIINVLAVQG
jgi:hypothetical protein